GARGWLVGHQAPWGAADTAGTDAVPSVPAGDHLSSAEAFCAVRDEAGADASAPASAEGWSLSPLTDRERRVHPLLVVGGDVADDHVGPGLEIRGEGGRRAGRDVLRLVDHVDLVLFHGVVLDGQGFGSVVRLQDHELV